jgi:glycosyltransferase involved in cell wall biosynthesis
MRDPIRVALLTAKMSPAAGGLSVSVPGLAHGLNVFDDVEMHVLGTRDPADPEAAMRWGPRVQAFPIVGPASLQRAPDMAPVLEELAPDVTDVQGLWTWTSRVSLDYWRRHQKPYVVTPRGMLDPWARHNSAWKKRLFAAFVENAHLRHAHCLRATAEMEAEHFREMGLRAPIAVVPNAIPIPKLAPRPASQRHQVLFLSRIHPKKGVDVLLQAWATLQDSHLDWDLVIAGIDENGHEAELKAQAERLRLQRVTFFGPVHGAAKDALYRSSDLFVLPTHAENFGLVVAEALAQEVPVITTTNAPWAGLEEKRCGWWIPLNRTRLAETMAHAMTRPRGDLRVMGERGRSWMTTDFAPKQVAAKMRDVYLWCAGRAERPHHVHE